MAIYLHISRLFSEVKPTTASINNDPVAVINAACHPAETNFQNEVE